MGIKFNLNKYMLLLKNLCKKVVKRGYKRVLQKKNKYNYES